MLSCVGWRVYVSVNAVCFIFLPPSTFERAVKLLALAYVSISISFKLVPVGRCTSRHTNIRYVCVLIHPWLMERVYTNQTPLSISTHIANCVTVRAELIRSRAVTGSVWNNPGMSGFVLMLRKVPSSTVRGLSPLASFNFTNRLLD